jgi:hypothetical protein
MYIDLGIDSIERLGDSAFRRISSITGILIWVGTYDIEYKNKLKYILLN